MDEDTGHLMYGMDKKQRVWLYADLLYLCVAVV